MSIVIIERVHCTGCTLSFLSPTSDPYPVCPHCGAEGGFWVEEAPA